MVGGTLFFGSILQLSNKGRAGFGPVIGNIFGGQQAILFVLLLMGAMAATLAIAALYAREMGTERGVGMVVALVAFVGLVLIFAGEIRLSGRAQIYGTAELYGMVLGALGVFALGLVVAMYVARVLPWWCGVALIVCAPALTWAMFLADLLYGATGRTTLALSLGAPWVVVGYAVFRAAERRTEQPTRVR